MKLKHLITPLLIGTAMGLHAQESPADNRGSVDTPRPSQQPAAQQDREGAARAPESPADNRGAVDTPSPAAGQPGVATGPGGGATGAGAARETHFAGMNAETVTSEELEPAVRTGLERGAVVAGGTLGNEVSRVQYGGERVVRSSMTLPSNQTGYVFVNTQGEIVKTQRPASLEQLPLGVRRIVEQQQQGASNTTLMLEEALGQTSYVLRVERENQPARWMQIDASGNVVRTLAEPRPEPAE
jgi:hypothetical protein